MVVYPYIYTQQTLFSVCGRRYGPYIIQPYPPLPPPAPPTPGWGCRIRRRGVQSWRHGNGGRGSEDWPGHGSPPLRGGGCDQPARLGFRSVHSGDAGSAASHEWLAMRHHRRRPVRAARGAGALAAGPAAGRQPCGLRSTDQGRWCSTVATHTAWAGVLPPVHALRGTVVLP